MPNNKWEERFVEKFPNTESGIPSYGAFCAVRDFIREQLTLARREESARLKEEAIRYKEKGFELETFIYSGFLPPTSINSDKETR